MFQMKKKLFHSHIQKKQEVFQKHAQYLIYGEKVLFFFVFFCSKI